MRRIYFSLFTIFFLGFSHLQAQLKVEFNGGTASSGSTIDIDVVVRDFDQIPSMQFSINWDPSAFTYNSIINVTDALSEFSVGSVGTPTTAVVVNEGQLTVSWSHSSTNPFSVDDGTRLFTIRLNAAGNPCDGTTLSITDTPRDIEVVNASFEEIGVTASGGDIMVEGQNCNGGGGGTDCTDECEGSTNFSLIASCESGKSDENICVKVTGRNVSNISSITTGVQWDPSVLRYTRTVAQQLPVALNENDANNGRLRVLWSITTADPLNLSDDAELFDICFDVIGAQGDESSIEFVDFADVGFNREVTDFTTGSDVDVCYGKGQISVTDGNGGGGGQGCTDTCEDSSDFSIIASCESGEANETICVPFTTRNFTRISAFQTGITWNNSVLRFNRFVQKDLAGVNFNESDASGGRMRISWFSNPEPTITLDDDSELFEICFDAIGNPGQGSDIEFSSFPDLLFDIEVADENANTIASCLSNGEIEIEREQQTSPLTLSAGNINGSMGEEACMDITVEGFEDIQSAQFTIRWDPDVLSYTELKNIELPEFGPSNVNFISPDRLRISWSPLSTASLADGTDLFQVCYNVIGACDSSSDIEFIGEANTEIEISNSNNEVLNPTLNSGSIRVQCGGGGGTNLEITAGNITGDMGEESCLNIRVTDFDEITSAQFTIEWDEDILRYTKVDGVRLTGFEESNAEFLSPDRLRINWNSQTPLNLSDNTVMMQVCFDVIGDCGNNESSNIRFLEGGGNNLSFVNSAGQTFTPAVNAGSIRVGTCSEVCNLAVSSVVEDNTCEQRGSITLNVSGDNGGLRYNWDNGLPNRPDHSGLRGGTYCVTVTDNANCEFTRCYELEELFFDTEAFIEEATCDDGGRISLQVEVNDENLRLDYDWDSPLRDGEIEQTNLDPGQYCVTISERRSRCEKVFCYTVRMQNDLSITATIDSVSNESGNNGAISLELVSEDDLTFEWSNGATTKDISGLTPGLYTVDITGAGDCEVTESFDVEWNTIFASGISAERSGNVSCMGAEDGIISGEVIGGCGSSRIYLDGEVVTLPIEGLSPGSYVIRVDDRCGNEDELTIEISEPETISATSVEQECSDPNSPSGSITLDISGGTAPFTLDPSSGIVSGNTVMDAAVGQLTILITDSNGCTALQEYEIEACDDMPGFSCDRARNLISPNGDGVNDNFEIGCLSGSSSINQPNELGIYDRWGREVFSANNYDNTWEGTDQSGNRLPEGGYMWVLKVDVQGQPVEVYRGTLTLLRSDF